MEFLTDFIIRFATQLQSPTMGFLIGGMVIAASGSNLKVPSPIYQFIIFMLLMKIGLKGGIEIRQADFSLMLLPALSAIVIGVLTVLIGSFVFSHIPNLKREDGIATAGLFGAVSASTLAVAMVLLEQESIHYEAWVPALYPFMDIPALILAIVLANIYLHKNRIANSEGNEDDYDNGPDRVNAWAIVKDSLRGSALSALILGLTLGLLTQPDAILESFYEPLFKGFLSILMLVMGMEAYARIHELKRVAQWYAVYALFAPIAHGLLAFGLGYIAHITVGFSPGGVILLAVMAASSSDISGPPTLRSGIPSANPSAYIGSSTSVGTPVAIAICIPLFMLMAEIIFTH